MRNKQQGFGMVEVIVSSFILGLGLLGMMTVITNSAKSTYDSQKMVQASIFAKDILEAITMIPFTTYQTANDMSTLNKQDASITKNCENVSLTSGCTKPEMVSYIVKQRYQVMANQGFYPVIRACPQNLSPTQTCVFISWGITNPTVGSTDVDCATYGTNDTVYKFNKRSQCLIVAGY